MKLSPHASSSSLTMPSPRVSPSVRRSAPAVREQADAKKEPAKKPANSSASDSGRGGADAAPKKRVRLKPETPEQLLERLRNPQLSLHEASILLRVSRATVRRYADSGRLNCQRTPGGQRRFYLRDIESFHRQLKLKR